MWKVCLDCREKYDETEAYCPKCGSQGWMRGEPDGSPEGRQRRQIYVDHGGYDGGGGGGMSGWVIFILIFVVGNIILYLTTGIFLIPIPRR